MPEETPQQKWIAELAAAEKGTRKFRERARSVVKKYIDERPSENSAAKYFNVFHANTNILKSSLYAQIPKPSVARKFKDYQDDVARVAGLMLQRAITQDLDDPRDTFDATMRQCVEDRLVPGLSMAWLRLETDTEPMELVTEPQPGMEAEPEPENITDQRIVVDYVYWEDFVWSPCRVWDERRWVGRKVYMEREALVKRFGAKGELCPLDFDSKKYGNNQLTPNFDDTKKAVVYEIWERATKKVFWLSKGMTEVLDERADPLGLVGFEPCPRPMLANSTTSDVTPRPDYYMIQDQYTELDTVNNRISLLVQACKVVGVYDKASAGVQRMLQEGTDNTLIPVDNWAMFAEKNGLKGQIDWMPLDAVVKALDQLNRSREAIKANR